MRPLSGRLDLLGTSFAAPHGRPPGAASLQVDWGATVPRPGALTSHRATHSRVALR
jgi:hypothetical protein